MRYSFLVAIAFLICSCEDDCTSPTYTIQDQEQYNIDIQKIEDYLAQNPDINANLADQGFYYEIVEPGGTGESKKRPNNCSTIFVVYEGTLLDGSKFDETQGDWSRFDLSNLVKGWQIGLPLIYEGGEINLFLPSEFGYGERDTPSIPSNSPLIFNIRLLYVENYLR